MNGCNHIKERIDEADKPDVLPFEVTEHIGHCNNCEAFAIERTALRKLVAGETRVSVPINFDAMLKARLAEDKSRRSSWWLGSAGYLRLGAATAGLVVMIFAAQSAGLFSGNDSKKQLASQSSAAQPDAPSTRVEPGPSNPSLVSPLPGPTVTGVVQSQYANSSAASKLRRGEGFPSRALADGYATAEDGGVVLVRGGNGDMDVQMPTVSVGAQPLLYVSAGQRSVRNVGTSF